LVALKQEEEKRREVEMKAREEERRREFEVLREKKRTEAF
jgi:hypothetical protein